jgi:hypothetical protein
VAYTSVDGVEIRVGRGSADNDKLSCEPQFRDSRVRGAVLHTHCVGGLLRSHAVARAPGEQDLGEECEWLGYASNFDEERPPGDGAI